MITLEKIVESIKLQLKPHITDDVILHDDWLIDIINQSRSALLRKLYLSGDNFSSFYQSCTLTAQNKYNQDNIYKYNIIVLKCPKIIGTIGKRNIQYVGSVDYSTTNIQYVEVENFIAHDDHRFGSKEACYTLINDEILIRNTSGQTQWNVIALFTSPNDVPGYDYKETAYPIDESDLRTLEIITFEHLAPKLGLPVDLLNNAHDETKNVNVGQQRKPKQQSNEQEEQ